MKMMLLWLQWLTVRCAHRSALMKGAGVPSMTSVFLVAISDLTNSVSVDVKQLPACTQVDQENAGTAIPNVRITAQEM